MKTFTYNSQLCQWDSKQNLIVVRPGHQKHDRKGTQCFSVGVNNEIRLLTISKILFFHGASVASEIFIISEIR